MVDDSRVIKCLTIPLGSRVLLLPQTAMCEIVRQPNVDRSVSYGVDWVIGQLPWRGFTIPVVELELFCGDINPRNPMAQAIVIHTIKQRFFDFYAIVSARIPQPVKVLSGNLKQADEPDACPLATMSVVFQHILPKDRNENEQASVGRQDPVAVALHGQELIIPDLALLERNLGDVLARKAA